MDYMGFSWILNKKHLKRIIEYGSTHCNRVKKKTFTGLPALLTSFARPT